MSGRGGFGSWKSQQDNEQTFDVYVARIPPEYDEAKLTDLFSPAGEVKGVNLKPGKGDYTSNYAFIKFCREADALCAVKYMNNFQVEGFNLLVSAVSTYKKNTQGSVNGGGFGGSASGPGGFQTSNEKTTTRGGFTGNRGRGGFGSSRGGATRSGGFGQKPSAQNGDSMGGDAFQNKSNSSLDGSSTVQPRTPTSPSPKQVTVEERVLVVHVEHPTKFWGQKLSKENAAAIQSITFDLKECPSFPTVTGELNYGQVFGCKFSEDDSWYRCKVEKHFPELGTKVKVRYIDYGNCEVVDQSSLVILPPSLSELGQCAREYDLGVKSVVVDEKSEKFKQGAEHLKNFILNNVLKIEKASGTNSFLQAYLNEKNDVNQSVISAGYATAVGKSEERPAFVKTPMGHQAIRPPRGVNSFEMSRENDEMKKRLDSLQAQLQNLRCGQEKKDTDYEMMKQKNIQLEHALAKCEAMNRNLSQSAVNSKLRSVAEEVRSLKKLRDSMHLEESLSPLLKTSVNLMSDKQQSIQLDNMDAYQELLKRENQLEEAQRDVKNCEKKDELEAVIKKRDDSRSNMLKQTDAFLTFINQLPFDTREKELECVLSDIKKTYVLPHETSDESFTDTSKCVEVRSVDQALQAYENWRLNKIDTVKELQNVANLCSLTLNNNLECLTQDLCLDKPTMLVEIEATITPSTENIDELIEKYSNAIASEIAQIKESNIDTEGTKMVMDLVVALVSSINAELNDIKKLRDDLRKKYEDKQEDIGSWVTKTPDVSKLKQVRNNLKTMKSKFRHKQADRRDFEEDPDEKEQLLKVEKELEIIRNELHAAFIVEHKLLEELSSVAETHFPELPVQYPDLGISTFLETGGLVKIRELEHYNHHALPLLSDINRQPLVFKTKFNQKPCVIKEYFLNDHYNKEVLTSKMVQYAKCKHHSLVALDGLFFDKGGRKAYLQTDYYNECTFPQFIKSKPNPKVLHRLLHELLRGLVCLHRQGIIHGSISPSNVFVTKIDGVHAAFLKEPNFLKDEAERFKHLTSKSPSHNFPMSNLELEPASMALDVYCFGLLILWAYFPDAAYSGDARQLVSVIVKDHPVLDILKCLLTEHPSSRMTAEDALLHSFFEIAEERPKSPSEELLTTMTDLSESLIEIDIVDLTEKSPGDLLADTINQELENTEVSIETLEPTIQQAAVEAKTQSAVSESAVDGSTAGCDEGSTDDAGDSKNDAL